MPRKRQKKEKKGIGMLKNNKLGCIYCIDVNGDCLYPFYGMKPQNLLENTTRGGSREKTVLKPISLINFTPDPEDKSGILGTFTHCPNCGACR